MKTRRVPWREIESLVNKLATHIKKKYDVIIGINRGGLIPSVMLSHITKIKHGVTAVESYQGRKKSKKHKVSLHISMIGEIGLNSRILLVDDIADSGESLIEVIKVLQSLGCKESHVDTATLHYKSQSKFKPTFYGKEVPNYDWLNYPWEKP